MERQSILKSSERTWVKIENDPLELCIVPAAGWRFGMISITGNLGTEQAAEFCRKFLVDFRGYTDKGEAVENTLEARIELLNYGPVQTAITEAVVRMVSEAAEGEEPAD